MKTRWLPVSTVLLLALAAFPAAADKSHGHGHDHKGDKHDRKDDKHDDKNKVLDILMKKVGLSEKKAKAAEAVLVKFAPERNKLVKELFEQRRTLRELLQKKSDDQAAYGKALKGLRSAQHKLRDNKDQQFEELAKILTFKEHALVLKEMPELQRRLRDAKDAGGGDEETKELDL